MTDIQASITMALNYLSTQSVEVPPEVWTQIVRKGVLKASGDLTAINAAYHTAITEALLSYLEGGNVAGPKNSFKRATVEAFGSAADLGWTDGGGDLPFTGDPLEWFNARLQAELGYIDLLFQQAKELRKSEEFDALAWASSKADGYTRTLLDVSNRMKLYAAGNKMLTFDGPDGSPDNICQRNGGTCVRLKGQRHKASWWISHDLVPYRGNPNYDCGAWECEHFLRDDKGERFMV